MRQKDVAPNIFVIAKRRKSSVKRALENVFGVSHMSINESLSIDHIV
jgi:hypothetical protein